MAGRLRRIAATTPIVVSTMITFALTPSFGSGGAVAQTIAPGGPPVVGAEFKGLPMGKADVVVNSDQVVLHPTKRGVERGFFSVPLPKVLDSVFVDVAELVLTVSTVYDTTEPLVIAAFPATVGEVDRPTSWSADWTEMSGGFDMENIVTASVLATEAATEIHLIVTPFVRRW